VTVDAIIVERIKSTLLKTGLILVELACKLVCFWIAVIGHAITHRVLELLGDSKRIAQLLQVLSTLTFGGIYLALLYDTVTIFVPWLARKEKRHQ